jgi:hypothetical protein
MKNYTHYSLQKHNTFGINVQCKRFIEYNTVEEAQGLARSLISVDEPLLIIGGGSNLLLTKDYEGTVIHSGINFLKQIDAERIQCGSAFIWDDFVAYCCDHELYGAENLSFIPGEVGASAVQNIGAYGAEVKDIIETVEVVELATGDVKTLTNAECAYSYRQSKFKNEWKNKYLIISVTYKLSKKYSPKLDYGNIRKALDEKKIKNPTVHELRTTIVEIRKAKLPDPKETGNAGSFFMNPIISKDKYLMLVKQFGEIPHYTIDAEHEKIPAGWMIEQCGWRGKHLGKAGVYDKQALVLVNLGNASGFDIVKLYRTIQSDVKQKFGIEIYPEVNIK